MNTNTERSAAYEWGFEKGVDTERERIIKLLEKRIDETPSELTKPSDFWRGVTSELSAIYALIKGENK